MSLDTVTVLGLNQTVTNVNVNGKAYPNFRYNSSADVCIKCSSYDGIDESDMCFFDDIDSTSV